MNSRSLARQTLRKLEFDFRSFTIERFLTWIGDRTGHAIFAIPWRMPAGMFGVWISDDDHAREYLFYRENLPRLHQVHIQLHELAHFLLGHSTYRINRNELATLLKKGKGESLLDLVQLRSPRTSQMEQEAETLASLIQEQVIKHNHLERLSQGVSSDRTIARMISDLGLA